MFGDNSVADSVNELHKQLMKAGEIDKAFEVAAKFAEFNNRMNDMFRLSDVNAAPYVDPWTSQAILEHDEGMLISRASCRETFYKDQMKPYEKYAGQK